MAIPKPTDNHRLRMYAVGFLGIILVAALIIVLLVLFGPTTSSKPLVGSLPVTCVYQFKVIAFDDLNGDSVQNTGEVGIANVKVSLQHSLSLANATPEQTNTDATGLAMLNRDDYCASEDTLTVNVDPLPDFAATTRLSFGPYPVSAFGSSSPTLTETQQIPRVMYIGLRQK